jgi:hypothetical protein
MRVYKHFPQRNRCCIKLYQAGGTHQAPAIMNHPEISFLLLVDFSHPSQVRLVRLGDGNMKFTLLDGKDQVDYFLFILFFPGSYGKG